MKNIIKISAIYGGIMGGLIGLSSTLWGAPHGNGEWAADPETYFVVTLESPEDDIATIERCLAEYKRALKRN